MPSSKESETGTTDEKDLVTQFKEAVDQLKIISEKLPDTEKEFDPIQYLLKSLKDSDVLIEYRIVAHGKNGEIFNIEGVSNLPRLFDESMLPEAPSNFENAFNSSIVRPCLNAFMKYTRDKVEEFKKMTLPLSSSFSLPANTDSDDYISQ